MTEPLFQRTADGKVYYYQTDHLGTPQRLVDKNGAGVWEARYEAFGKAEVVVSRVENNLRFPGQYFDGETGLHHNYFRDYEPDQGRYLQTDPLGLYGGRNVYTYAYARPTKYTDPLGLFCLPPVAIAAISGAVGGAVTGLAAGPQGALAGAFAGGLSAGFASYLGGVAPSAATGGVAGAITGVVTGGRGGAVPGFAGGAVAGTLAAGAHSGALSNAVAGGAGGLVSAILTKPDGVSNFSKNLNMNRNLRRSTIFGFLGGLAQDLMQQMLTDNFACEGC